MYVYDCMCECVYIWVCITLDVCVCVCRESDGDLTDGFVPLSVPMRKGVELEAVLLTQQTELFKLQKEVLRLNETLDKRDAAISALNSDLFKAREHITGM